MIVSRGTVRYSSYSLITILLRIAQQIQKGKRGNTKHLLARFRIMNTKVVCILRNDDCDCRFGNQFRDGVIVRDWRTLPVFHLDQNVVRVVVINYNVNFLVLPSATIVSNGSRLLIILLRYLALLSTNIQSILRIFIDSFS